MYESKIYSSVTENGLFMGFKQVLEFLEDDNFCIQQTERDTVWDTPCLSSTAEGKKLGSSCVSTNKKPTY